MKKIFLPLILITLLNAASPFETPKDKFYDLSVFETHRITKELAPSQMVKCRVVCDKKQYKEQVLKSAVGFYKHSKTYRFDGGL